MVRNIAPTFPTFFRLKTLPGELPRVFEFLDHTADAAARLTAADVPGLVQSGVEALLSLYLGESEAAMFVAATDAASAAKVPVTLEAEDGESLLVDFLNELIFLFDTRRFLCGGFEVEDVCLDSPARFKGELLGTNAAESRGFKTEVKAATFHGVEIVKEGGMLTVDVVFDL